MQDIIKSLKADHDQHRDLFERLKATTTQSAATRLALLEQLDLELRLHMRFEEDVFFPALRAHADKDTRGQTLEAYAEHEAARATLNELESVSPEDEMWEAWLKVLSEELEHHMKEEEDDLFPQATELIDEDNRRVMAIELERWKTDAGQVVEQTDDEPVPRSRSHHTQLVGLH